MVADQVTYISSYKWNLYAVWGVLHCTSRQYTTYMDTNTGPIRGGINRVGKAPYTSPKILGGDGEPKNFKKQNFGGLSHTKPSKKTEKRGRCYK